MARRGGIEDWTVSMIGVSFDKEGNRRERPLEEIPKEELKEIARRKNRETMKLLGYTPVRENAN